MNQTPNPIHPAARIYQSRQQLGIAQISPIERIEVIRGDITKLIVDAVVNAANRSLMGGGGVDGAIHRAAGPGLLEECAKLGGCPTGEVRLTQGHSLPAKFILHAVGPIFQGGGSGEATLLRSCYLNALQIASEKQFASVAFPCISTGIYGYPKSAACEIAVMAVLEWLTTHEYPNRVIFCCYEPPDLERYRHRLGITT